MELKDLSFASEVYLPEGWMGMVRLAPPPLADFARVDAGQCRYHLDHDWSKPVGKVLKAWHDESSGMYRCDVDIPEIEATATKDYLAQREGGLRGDVSVGYNIERLILVEIGKTWDEDKFDAAWETARNLRRHRSRRRNGRRGAQFSSSLAGRSGPKHAPDARPRLRHHFTRPCSLRAMADRNKQRAGC